MKQLIKLYIGQLQVGEKQIHTSLAVYPLFLGQMAVLDYISIGTIGYDKK
jgi:hypothetical protein